MAAFDYQCEKCGDIELEHSVHQDAYKECPVCRQNGIESKIRRLISKNTTFQLNGTGWYKDGYSSK
jgi:putative FmdB family regulatory protein